MNAHTPNPKVEEWIERAKSADILEVAQKAGAILKKSGSEHTGPCVFCGGTDRFSVNPRLHKWNCRGADGGSSVVGLYMHAQRVSFFDAIEAITGEAKPDGIREESDDERAAREARTAKQQAEVQRRKEQDARKEAAKQLRDEEVVADAVERAVPIFGTHGEAYFREARKLDLKKRFMGDIMFIKDWAYWGLAEPGAKTLTHLATLPAIVALIRDVSGENVIGMSTTVLDPVEPRKWVWPAEAHLPKKERLNDPTKTRGDKKHGMIRLGPIGPRLAIAEGYVNALSWYQLGFGDDGISLAAAVDLYNLSGHWIGRDEHPTQRNPKTGKPTPLPTGVPDMTPEGAGVILPDWVKAVTMIGDGDSERLATRRCVATGAARYRNEGRKVDIHFSPDGYDFNDVLQRHVAGDNVMGIKA